MLLQLLVYVGIAACVGLITLGLVLIAAMIIEEVAARRRSPRVSSR